MSSESTDDFEIRVSFPSINPMYDDIEQKVLSPLSCLKEVGSEWILELDLPLVEKNDISVTLDNENTITVEAKLRETYSESRHDYKYEFEYFKKTITLPTKIEEDKISAKFENGRLTIRIPKQRIGNKIPIE